MVEGALERVQADLETIREGAGLELRFGWEDVWANLAAAVGSLIAFVWAMIFDGPKANWGFLPVVVFAVVWTVWARGKYRWSTGRSALRRREYSASMLLAAVLVSLLLLYRLWAVRLGMPAINYQAVAFVMVGFALVSIVVLDKRRLDYLPWGLCMLFAGLAMPWVSWSAQAVIAMAFTLAGPACALIQARQLRRVVNVHAAN